MKKLFIYACLIFCSGTAFAETHKAFLKLEDGVERYIEYSEPQPGKPWIVFTNGLVYELDRWRDLDQELKSEGYGILHYYFRGQNLTLRREAEQFQTPLFFAKGLERQDFVEELSQILNQLKVSNKVIMVGLSYGAHIVASFAETYPDKVETLVFMAPLVVPLDKYTPEGQWLNWNLQWARLIWGPYFYEYAYRQIYRSYFDKRVTPDRVPEALENIPEVYKESLFHLVRAVRDFNLKDQKFAGLKPNSVHFFVSQEETPEAFEDQVKAFDGVDKKTQGSLIWLPDASHAIPDSAPEEAAHYLHALITRDSRLVPGKKYKSTMQGLISW